MPDASSPPGRGTVVQLTAADGTELAGWHLPPAATAGSGIGILLAHGFTGSAARPAVRQVASSLSGYAGVLVVDLRGHGRSGGVSTLGDREALDVDAGLKALRMLGYPLVAGVGFSMGASAVLRQAGLVGGAVHGSSLRCAPDLVVAVSATSRWAMRESAAMRRVTWLATSRLGRRVAGRMGARIDAHGWPTDEQLWPLSPEDVIGRIAVPVLVVHGQQDHYFGLDHPRALASAARRGGTEVEVWELPGFGHAEAAAAAAPEVTERIGRWLVARAAGIEPASSEPASSEPAGPSGWER